MEYEDELDRMRNRKRRPAVRQTEIKKQTVSRRYAEPEKRQGTRKRQEMRLEYEDFSDGRQADRSRRQAIQKQQAVPICLEAQRQQAEENREMVSQRCIRWQPRTGRREPRKKRESRKQLQGFY